MIDISNGGFNFKYKTNKNWGHIEIESDNIKGIIEINGGRISKEQYFYSPGSYPNTAEGIACRACVDEILGTDY